MAFSTKALLLVGLILAAGLAGRLLFPRTVEVASPVVIHAIHDTVEKLDTVRITKLVQSVKVDTAWLERETVAKPETVTVVPDMRGVTAIFIPKHVGDTSRVLGFEVRPLGAGHYTMNEWTSAFYTPGPFAALKVNADRTVSVAWYKPAPPPCTFWCKASAFGVGAAVGILTDAVLHAHN